MLVNTMRGRMVSVGRGHALHGGLVDPRPDNLRRVSG